MTEFSNEEGAILAETFRAGSIRWDTYLEKCQKTGLDPRRLLNLEVLRFLEVHMVGGEHEGRGFVADREIADDSTLSLTDRGRKLAEPVSRIREIFCDDSSASLDPEPPAN